MARCLIGALDEHVALIISLGPGRDATARRNADRIPADRIKLIQNFEKFCREANCPLAIFLHKQDSELISTDSRSDVGATNRALKALRRRLKQGVTGRVAHCVVDGLEAAYIDEQDGK